METFMKGREIVLLGPLNGKDQRAAAFVSVALQNARTKTEETVTGPNNNFVRTCDREREAYPLSKISRTTTINKQLRQCKTSADSQCAIVLPDFRMMTVQSNT